MADEQARESISTDTGRMNVIVWNDNLVSLHVSDRERGSSAYSEMNAAERNRLVHALLGLKSSDRALDEDYGDFRPHLTSEFGNDLGEIVATDCVDVQDGVAEYTVWVKQ